MSTRPVVALLPGPPEDGRGAGDELLEAERLLQVVVAAEREPAHLVLGGVAGGQEQHRRPVALGAHPAADLEPVEVGQHHVEHDEVRRGAPDGVEGVATVGHRRHLEAVVAERRGEHRAQVLFVVDDQQMLSRHAVSLACESGSWL